VESQTSSHGQSDDFLGSLAARHACDMVLRRDLRSGARQLKELALELAGAGAKSTTRNDQAIPWLFICVAAQRRCGGHRGQQRAATHSGELDDVEIACAEARLNGRLRLSPDDDGCKDDGREQRAVDRQDQPLSDMGRSYVRRLRSTPDGRRAMQRRERSCVDQWGPT
jgi:hypothetical protein